MRFPRIVAECRGSALIHNARILLKLTPELKLIPVLKANAYGHDAVWVAKTLLGNAFIRSQTYGLGVATLEEGFKIRMALGQNPIPIMVFSGGAFLTEEKLDFLERFALSPIIASLEDFKFFIKKNRLSKIPYHLKFNTGMNRLGISTEELDDTLRLLKNTPANKNLPATILSHLAMGDQPTHPLSRRQQKFFTKVRGAFQEANLDIPFHLANSAGVWHHKSWNLTKTTHMIRPGLSLYGIRPWASAKNLGLEPVLTLRAPITLIHHLKKGEWVGYGGTFRASGNKIDSTIAVIPAGYADGIPRVLSNGGLAWVGTRMKKIVGRVSMDMLTVSTPPNIRRGEWVELLGPHIDPWTQARLASTIPYELLTSISGRVLRVFK